MLSYDALFTVGAGQVTAIKRKVLMGYDPILTFLIHQQLLAQSQENYEVLGKKGEKFTWRLSHSDIHSVYYSLLTPYYYCNIIIVALSLSS